MRAHHDFTKCSLLAACGAVLLVLSIPLAEAQTAPKADLEDVATTHPTDLTTAKLENTIGTRCALGDGVPQNYGLAAQ
ncbi:MAG: hypothetical protein B7Z70_12000, partial [Acidithiobacillus ferrivorans]